MKKVTKRLLCLLLVALLTVAMLPIAALAANWEPTDKITINVRVFDQSTGKAYDVGTDTVTKGDQYIQSDPYQIPELSDFTTNSYGRVTKVAGNWYSPSGDRQPGSTVYWSCNSNSATMTYWVTEWNAGSDSGTGGDSEKDVIDLGGSGSHTINFSIKYHSNYPDGTDYVVTQKYTVKNYATMYNIFSSQFLTYADCEFGGYTPKVDTKTWYRDAASTDRCGNIGAENGKTYDLYAGWKTGGTPATTVTLTYVDRGNTYATQDFLAGDTVIVSTCSAENEGYTFKGWDTDSSAETVVYAAGDSFAINSSMSLYAVWEENETPDPVDPDKKTSKPGMDKKVLNAAGTWVDGDASFTPGSEVSFILKSTIPEELKQCLKDPAWNEEITTLAVTNGYEWGEADGEYVLTFHDKMDAGLSLVDGSIVVKIGDTTLTADQYTLLTATDGCTFEVALDLVALFNAGVIDAEDLGVTPVTVEYKATVQDDFTNGTLYNDAWVNGNGDNSEHDKPDVDVYAIEVIKVDKKDSTHLLPDAEFALYDNAACTGDPIATAKTGADGKLLFGGLAAGTYYLKEISAPENYVKSDDIFTIVIQDGGKYTVGNGTAQNTTADNIAEITVPNAPTVFTGGSGTMIFTVVGVIILAAACAVFVISRKKKSEMDR